MVGEVRDKRRLHGPVEALADGDNAEGDSEHRRGDVAVGGSPG